MKKILFPFSSIYEELNRLELEIGRLKSEREKPVLSKDGEPLGRVSMRHFRACEPASKQDMFDCVATLIEGNYDIRDFNLLLETTEGCFKYVAKSEESHLNIDLDGEEPTLKIDFKDAVASKELTILDTAVVWHEKVFCRAPKLHGTVLKPGDDFNVNFNFEVK
jgi:hypothetical protein